MSHTVPALEDGHIVDFPVTTGELDGETVTGARLRIANSGSEVELDVEVTSATATSLTLRHVTDGTVEAAEYHWRATLLVDDEEHPTTDVGRIRFVTPKVSRP